MSVDDISLEPLFNQSSVGSGANKKTGSVPIDTAGAMSHRTAITVTATPQLISIATGKRSMEIQNTGSSLIYLGGSGVDSNKGIKLFQNQGKFFGNVTDSFSFYAVCAAGETSTLRIAEYV